MNKKDKKGLDLTEIVGMIAIFGAITLFLFWNISKSEQERKKEEKYESKRDYLTEKAINWGKDNEDELVNYNIYYLSLDELKENGYIKEDDVKDPRDNSTMNGCITIHLNNETYEYTYVDESCKENQMITTSIMEKVNSSNHIIKLDSDENIRYIGSNPNNYVNFNNELWRIVGIFNGKAKLVRNNYYNEKMAWNNDNINDWNESSLNKELNENFYNQIESKSKSYIEEFTWDLDGYNKDVLTRKEFYESEKKDSWKGMIGLLSPSDYGYATSSNNCDTDMNHWSEECYQNSWLYSESSEWTMTSNTSNNHNVFIYSNGIITSVSSENKNISVRPALYLKENVKITKGNGTESNPYYLTM